MADSRLLADAIASEPQGKGGLCFWNKNKAIPPANGRGVQFPKSSAVPDGFICSISDPKSNVNQRLAASLMHRYENRSLSTDADAKAPADVQNDRDQTSAFILIQDEVKVKHKNSVDPEAEAEERGKGTKADSLVDLYTEEQYNAFGWTRVNDVLTDVEKRTLDSAHMAYEKGFEPRPITRTGEIVILLGDNRKYTKLVYVKGTPENQIITKVYSGDSMFLKEVEILEGLRSKDAVETVEILEGIGYIEGHRNGDYAAYLDLKGRSRQGSEQAGAGNPAANAGRAGSAAEDPESLRGSICRRISSADIVVGIKEDGSATLYDLFNI